MDDRTKLREMLAALTQQVETFEYRRKSVETALQMLEEFDASPNSEPTKPGKKKGNPPDATTNVGRAIIILRGMAPQGLTLLQLIEKSAESGRKPFVNTSISSQLRFQGKRGFVKKEGDKYYAVMD